MSRKAPASLRPHKVLSLVILGLALAACSSGPGPSRSPSGSASVGPTVAASSTPEPSATLVLGPTMPLPGDGQPWIVYQRWTQATGARLRLVRPDGSGDHELLPEMTTEQSHPDWSPTGDRITFASENAVWVVNADGTGARKLTECQPPCLQVDNPAWSPDGTRIAFVRADFLGDVATSSSVQTVEVATGLVTTLAGTVGPEYATYPRWSGDGTALVLELDRFQDAKVATKAVVGSALAVLDLTTAAPTPRIITDWSTFAAYPDWSWKTRRIVFSTYDLGYRDFGNFVDPAPPSNLFTLAPDADGRTQLTRYQAGPNLIRNNTASGTLATQPTWSPDGRQIIFTLVDGATWPGWSMAVVGADGAGLVPLTGQKLLGTHPRFRPTG